MSLFTNELLPLSPSYQRWLEMAPMKGIKIQQYKNGFFWVVDIEGFCRFSKTLQKLNWPTFPTRQQSERAYYDVLLAYYQTWDAEQDGFDTVAKKELRLFDAFKEFFSKEMKAHWREQKRVALAFSPTIEYNIDDPKEDLSAPENAEWIERCTTPPSLFRKLAVKAGILPVDPTDQDMDEDMDESEGEDMDTEGDLEGVDQADVDEDILMDENDTMADDMEVLKLIDG